MKKSLLIYAKKIWEYIAIIALIVECSSIYFNQQQWTLISSNYALIVGFLPLTITAVLYLLSNKHAQMRLSKAVFCYLGFIVIYLITLGKVEMLNFLMKFGVIFPCIGLYVLYLFDTKGIVRFANRYVKIVVIIASLSLVIWLMGSVAGIIHPTGNLTYTWGSMTKTANSYFNIQFETQLEQTVFGIWRNTAFFTEAPKYGLVLSVAYIFNYLFENNKKVSVLLLITIISTFSFTAMLAVILIHFIKYSLNVGRDVLIRRAKARTIIWPIMIGIVLLVIYFLMRHKLDTSSGVGRVGDYIVCFGVGMRHPIFGWGFMDNEYLNTILHSSRLASGVGNTMGLSNSICQIFVDGGIYLLAFYLIPIITIILLGKKYNDKNLSVGIVFLYFVITTYFAYAGIMFFLISL